MGAATGSEEHDSTPRLTRHVASRMGSRRISHDDVATVMSYGRTDHVRGAVVYAFGRREAEICQMDGMHPERVKGLQVVCVPEDNRVITVYRNNDFSSLRRRNNRWTT